MFKRTIFSLLTLTAGAAAYAVYKLVKESEEEDDLFDGDDDVHFIHINDADDEKEDLAEIQSLFKETMDEDVHEELDIDAYLDRASKEYDEREELNVPQEVMEICAVYPYLEASFVQEILNKNEILNAGYPFGSNVSIKHVTKFYDEQTANSFVQIMQSAGYLCEQLGVSVTASKPFQVEAGAIISDILNVANQTNALEGEYLEFILEK